MVYGATDGVVTTLAVVAGVSAAGFDGAVAVVLGVANLAADGLSMGASNYLGLKSELEQTGGAEAVAAERPLRHGLATFGAFVVAGAVPLLSFAVPLPSGTTPLLWSAALSALVLLSAGAARAPFIGQGRVQSALEMLAIGGAAGLAAYGLGALVAPMVT